MVCKCKRCGKEINHDGEYCVDCSRKGMQEIFQKYPDVKQAFKESINEMKKPENMKKMVDDTVRFMTTVQGLQERARKEE